MYLKGRRQFKEGFLSLEMGKERDIKAEKTGEERRGVKRSVELSREGEVQSDCPLLINSSHKIFMSNSFSLLHSSSVLSLVFTTEIVFSVSTDRQLFSVSTDR